MKKAFVMICLPLALASFFACKKDKDSNPESQLEPISGVYFRFKLHDSTVVYQMPRDTITLEKNFDSEATSFASPRDEVKGNWDISQFNIKQLPAQPGTYQAFASVFDGPDDFPFEDSVTCTITKVPGKLGDTMEGSFSGILHKSDAPTDTLHIQADFRLSYDKDLTNL